MLILKIIRKVYTRYLGNKIEKPTCIQDPEKASKLLYDILKEQKLAKPNCLQNFI